MNVKGDDEAQPHRRASDHWRIGKEIPLALVGAVIIQTAALVWSIAGLYNRVETLVVITNELKQERYTKEDGRRDREMLVQSQGFQRQRDDEQDRRINQLEVITAQILRGIK